MAELKGNMLTVDSCINDYLTESEQSNHKYFKLWHIAYRGVEDLGLSFFYQVQSFKLPVTANKTVPLPEGYRMWSKVGPLNDRGEIISIQYNNKLTTYADLSTDRIGKTEDNALWDWNNFNSPFFFNWWNGDYFAPVYGVASGGPFIGTFKIDDANNLLLLDPFYGYPYIMVECIVTPKEGDQIFIPSQFREALISWIRWKDNISSPATSHMGIAEKQIRRKEYFNDRRLALAKWRPINITDAYNWALENTRFTIKA